MSRTARGPVSSRSLDSCIGGCLVVRDAGGNLSSADSDRRDLAFEAGRAGTWHWDIASGTIVWDDRLEAMYGLGAGGFQRTFGDWIDLLHPDDVEAFVADVQVARTLQESLLGPPLLVEGAGHAARYLPAAARLDVGGDWYNAQRLVDGRIAIAVGDVVGNGLEAATVMGQLRSALSACAYRAGTAADVIETLDLFAESVPGAQAATTVLALVDLAHGSVEYSRAGHPPPMLVSPEGIVEVLEGGCGWPLAVGGIRAPRPSATAPFPSGSLLVLYSDGLIERRTESIEVGLRRLQQSIQ